jgi:hypothetical protein
LWQKNNLERKYHTIVTLSSSAAAVLLLLEQICVLSLCPLPSPITLSFFPFPSHSLATKNHPNNWIHKEKKQEREREG